MTSNRSYRTALASSEATRRLASERDITYDPAMVDALIEVVAEQRTVSVLNYAYCLTH